MVKTALRYQRIVGVTRHYLGSGLNVHGKTEAIDEADVVPGGSSKVGWKEELRFSVGCKLRTSSLG